MLIQSQTRQAKGDIKKRQHLMERSFAYSTRYGYQRARWRRLWRVKIQEYLTSAIQNIMVLVRNIKEQRSVVQAKLPKPRPIKALFNVSWLNIEPRLWQLGRFGQRPSWKISNFINTGLELELGLGNSPLRGDPINYWWEFGVPLELVQIGFRKHSPSGWTG